MNFLIVFSLFLHPRLQRLNLLYFKRNRQHLNFLHLNLTQIVAECLVPQNVTHGLEKYTTKLATGMESDLM